MLPIAFDLAPMEAKRVGTLPDGDGWQFEPKWDGFRCLAFRDGDDVQLMSKSGKPLQRFFPEAAAMLLRAKSKRFVLDGELVVPMDSVFRLVRCRPGCTLRRAASHACPRKLRPN